MSVRSCSSPIYNGACLCCCANSYPQWWNKPLLLPNKALKSHVPLSPCVREGSRDIWTVGISLFISRSLSPSSSLSCALCIRPLNSASDTETCSYTHTLDINSAIAATTLTCAYQWLIFLVVMTSCQNPLGHFLLSFRPLFSLSHPLIIKQLVLETYHF